MYGLDAYRQASQNIIELNYVTATLPTYIKLLDADQSAAQKHLLVSILERGLNKLYSAQTQLDRASSDFKAAVEKTSELKTRYKNKSDENSESIKRVLEHFTETLNKVCTDIDEFSGNFKDKNKVIGDLKSRIEETEPAVSTNDDAELRNALIQSSQKLIADIKEFRQNNMSI